MAETEVFLNAWTPFPDYALSSTGSLRLSGLQERCPSTVVGFEGAHRKQDEETSVRQRVVRGVSKAWSKMSWKRTVNNHLPIVKTLRRYKVSRDLLSDVVAGVTVGVMMIPQAMAFAFVATLPPIIGLYMAFFSSLVYVFLGTAHHLSWNCVAVLAIMMGNLLDTYDAKLRHTLISDVSLLNNVTSPHLLHHNLLLPFPPNVSSTALPNGTALTPSAAPHSAPFLRLSSFFFGEQTAAAAPDIAPNVMPATSAVHISDAVTNYSTVMDSVTSSPRVSQLEKMIINKKIELACSVTLLSGIILAVLGKLGLGRLASFMSDSLVISFMVGVSFHVYVGQVGNALGLDLPSHSGVFKIFKLLADIATHLKDTNTTTAIIFVLCAVTIYTVKHFVNEKYADKMKVPIPVELIVVIIATIVNAQMKMNETHSVSIVEEISVGLPAPKLPDISVGLGYLSEGLIIIVVSFTQTVALGKIMALKHNYRIDCNKEMFSLGIASVVCSFFSGFIPGASITCSVIQESAGGKTQISTLFSAALVLVVVMFLGPYFYYLPRCVLAAIVFINMRSLFLKLLTMPSLWRKSRVDCIVWVSTCLATVVLDTDLGLLVGMAVCMSGVLVRSMISPVRTLGQVTVEKLHLWRSVEKYHDAEELPGVKVVGISSDFYFVNAELITDHIVKMSGINPSKLKRKGIVLHINERDASKTGHSHGTLDSRQNSETSVSEQSTHSQENGVGDAKTSESGHLIPPENQHTVKSVDKQCPTEPPLTSLIIDFSCVSFIDLMAVNTLEVLIRDYEAVGVKVFLTHLHERCVHTLRATGFLDKHCDKVYISTAAALNHT
ncbi:hypothetical protein ACOMHN_057570 [Nucella lapillus]